MARTKQTKEEATKGRRATNAPAPRQELSKGKVLDPEPQPMEVDDTDGESDETSRGDLVSVSLWCLQVSLTLL